MTLALTATPAPTVTLAMIVKNEAETLGSCLESVAGHVDEIVIVDTGSRDATKKIARHFTDRILTYKWHDDAAAARQFAFDQVTSDWVCWLDADDVVAGAGALRGILAGLEPEVDAILWPYVYSRDAWGAPRQIEWFIRCIRTAGLYRWVYPVHEWLAADSPTVTRWVSEIVVEHHPEQRAGERDPARYLGRIRAAAVDGDPRMLFILGHEESGAGNRDAAIAAFERLVATPTGERYHYQSEIWIGKLHASAERYEAAIDTYLAALKRDPTWPDAYFGLAETYYYRREWAKVVHWTEIGQTIPVPGSIAAFDPLRYAHQWIIHYTNALFHLGRVEEALAWTRTALGYDPDDPWHRENLRFYSGLTRPVVSSGR